MITSRDLERIPLFAGVDERNDANLQAAPPTSGPSPAGGSFREGEEARFIVILEGELEPIKETSRQRQVAGFP